MTFTEAVKAVYSDYANFSGRARRSEYWWWALYMLITGVVLALIDGGGVLSGLWSLAHLLPGLGVAVRRLHDIDRSGWWFLVGLIPLVGAIVLIVFFATRGTPGPNRFGEDPIR
jgi:uncharacterized membrane protein YhaH (DUF805 family)